MIIRRIAACVLLFSEFLFAGTASAAIQSSWYAKPDWWQLLVAAVGVIVIAWQVVLTRQAAEAAQANAIAAKDNIDIFISKERARLVVELDNDFDLLPDQGVYFITYLVRIMGTTPATIIEAKAGTYIVPELLIAEEETGDRRMIPLLAIPRVIPANAEPIEESALIGLAGEEDMKLFVEEINAHRLVLGIRGFITYKDVFDRVRRTSFRYVWRPSFFGGIQGKWIPVGAQVDNEIS